MILTDHDLLHFVEKVLETRMRAVHGFGLP
jgi:hypothetical protein